MGWLVRLEQEFGFVPRLFRAQTVPRIAEAQAGLVSAILFDQGALTRIQKERILRGLAAARSDAYWLALHHQTLEVLGDRAGTTGPADPALKNEAILDTMLTTALGSMLGTLSAALRPEPDFAPPLSVGAEGPLPLASPYLHDLNRDLTELASFCIFEEHFGFVPAMFRAQSLRPSVLDAEAEAIGKILVQGEQLSQLQKDRIVVVVAAANGNTYLVALYAETLAASGIPKEFSYRIASDHRACDLPAADLALLDFARKLAATPDKFHRADLDTLLGQSFTEEQVQEAIAVTAFTNFLTTLQAGLGVAPDFAPLQTLQRGAAQPEKIVNLSPPDSRPTATELPADPDSEPVAMAQNGDLEAFETLVNRHSQRVYRTLLGMLGSPDEARDAMQDTFLKVFQNLGRFERRSKFSTWLVSIASNTGLQRLRERKHIESLDEEALESEDGFRPRQVRAWTEDPEQLYSQTERRALVEKSVMQLPAKYRVVVMLRDIEQLSAEETAAALGIGIPALKSRLLRGRLMVREALAPHFGARPRGVPA